MPVIRRPCPEGARRPTGLQTNSGPSHHAESNRHRPRSPRTSHGSARGSRRRPPPGERRANRAARPPRAHRVPRTPSERSTGPQPHVSLQRRRADLRERGPSPEGGRRPTGLQTNSGPSHTESNRRRARSPPTSHGSARGSRRRHPHRAGAPTFGRRQAAGAFSHPRVRRARPPARRDSRSAASAAALEVSGTVTDC